MKSEIRNDKQQMTNLNLRIPVLSFVLCCLILPVSCRTSESPLPSRGTKPNFVFILADDLGYGDLSCYGAPDIKTPNLDRLAAEGVRFTQFYANGPVCTPTRCGLMTGRYQQRYGLEWAIPPSTHGPGLPPAERLLPRLLRDAGYATAMAGKWHLGYEPPQQPNAHGFGRFFGLLSGNHDYFAHREITGDPDLYLDGREVEREGYSTHLITRHALEFMAGMKDRPFFLYVAYNAPHFPMQGPEDRDVRPATKTWNHGTRETFVKMVEAMDAGIGEILAALEQEGLAKNTLVVFTSDNGGDTLARNAPLRDKKGTLWEGGIRAPCIARRPGRIPAGSTTAQVGITMDWTRTFVNVAGAKFPEDRSPDGIDLGPVIDGRASPAPRTLFWRRFPPTGEPTHRAARDGDWKYLEDLKTGKGSLFNLAKDVGESDDLAVSRPERAAAMRRLVDAWEKVVDPPLYPENLPGKR